MEKVQNLLSFSDFDKSWKAKEPKKTKRTEIGVDVLEKKYIQDEDELLDDDEIIEDDEIIDDDIEEVEDEGDGIEDSDWQEQLKALIDQIIEDGEEPEEVQEFIEDYFDGFEGDEEGEEVDLDDDDEEIVDDIEDDEIIDDEEGEGIQENVRNFKNWKR